MPLKNTFNTHEFITAELVVYDKTGPIDKNTPSVDYWARYSCKRCGESYTETGFIKNGQYLPFGTTGVSSLVCYPYFYELYINQFT